MWVNSDLVGVGCISLALMLVIGIAEILQRKKVDSEVTRKFVHVLSGLVCLFIPFLIESIWVVLGMASSLFVLFYVADKYNYIMSIHGVNRVSRGTIYYPLAIFLIFFFSNHQPWLYVTSILVLALSDAAASLVGGRYGSVYYWVEDEKKSLEGSIIFILLTFLAVQIPTLLMTDIPNLEVILASLLVAVLVTGVEAIALEGTDNLYIPVSVCLVLEKMASQPFYEIIYQSVSLLICFVGISLMILRFRAFNAGATILIGLFLFGAWSLGSEVWVLPLVTMGVWYFILWYFYSDFVHYKYNKVRRTAKALTVPFLILIAANYTNHYQYLFAPYVASITTLFMVIFYNFVRVDKLMLAMPDYCRAIAICVLSWVGIVLPTWYFSVQLTLSAALAMLPILMLVCLYNTAIPALSEKTLDKLNSKNSLYPAVSAGTVFLLQYLRVI